MSVGADDLLVALHDAHARDLWAYVVRLTRGDAARAEDVVQETLLRAWRHPEVLRRDDGGVRAWLFTVARNLVVDERRSGRWRREVLAHDVPEPPPGPDGADVVLQGWLVAEALRRLSREHRDVLVLCFYGGASVREAAERLGVPEGTVKSRTHYGLRALRLVLEEMGVGR